MKESSIAAFGWTVLVPAAVALALVATGGLRADDAAPADATSNAPPAAPAHQWANLKGEFVYVGPIPQPVVFGGAAAGAVDESLVVGKMGELANVAVYLRTPDVPVHPDYAETANATVVLESRNARYRPHMLFLRTSQALALVNAGPGNVACKPKVFTLKNPQFEKVLPAGVRADVQFPAQESLPTGIADSINGWMKAYLVVRDSPYAAVSAANGTFEIKNLPAGQDLEFQLWQEKAGYVKDVQMQGAKADAKGRFKIKLKAGDNDLGAIKCPAKLFEKK